MEAQPLIVIVGPTASGKTALAVDLAEKYGGEIICADSRTVYTGMDIGTAKPSKNDQSRVRHWGLDLVSPDERFNASDFKKYALEKISDIRARGNIPFLVGGTGLYIDGVIFDYQFGDAPNQRQRNYLESLSAIELQEYCFKNNITLPVNIQNKRHLIRAIEQKSINSKRQSEPIENSYIVGISTEYKELRTRIELRAEQLFKNNILEETTNLAEKYGWGSEAMTGNIYQIMKEYHSGHLDLQEAKEKCIVRDLQLAKRQKTWFKRNTYIDWMAYEKANSYLSQLLAREH